ncbi:MAG: hypothetical protein MPN21_23855 [Thermoanaerobaculia bacterium]|nr:hypothetical protein [Thermoanaerobaculia bacterium]
MNVLQSFLAYAEEFESTYKDDDWTRLRKYFADDAVYEVKNVSYACRLVGPDAIFAGIKKSIDQFDRRMDSRRIEVLSPPEVDGYTLDVSWAVTYSRAGAPPIRISASTTCSMDEGRITHLADSYDEGQEEELRTWLDQHAPDLDPSYI